MKLFDRLDLDEEQNKNNGARRRRGRQFSFRARSTGWNLSFLASAQTCVRCVTPAMDKKKIFLVSRLAIFPPRYQWRGGSGLPALSEIHLRFRLPGGRRSCAGLFLSFIPDSAALGLLSDRLQKPWFIPARHSPGRPGRYHDGLYMSNYWAIFAAIAISGIGSAFFTRKEQNSPTRLPATTRASPFPCFP